MKKLFTLVALLACFMGANAKEIVDAEVDFSQYTDISQVKWAGWGASSQALERLSIKDGCLHFESSECPKNDEGVETGWLCQFHPIGMGNTAEIGTVYTLHYKIKGSVASDGNVSMLGFGLTPYGQFPITTEWVEGTVDYEASSSSGDILMQCGGYIGSWDIAYLKITHEGKEQRPATWQEWLTSDGQPVIVETTSAAIPTYMGNAETPWPDWASDHDAAWRGDRTGEICAWGKTKGRNEGPVFNPTGENEGKTGFNPFPADIEADPDDATNKVFVVHGAAATTEGDPSAWDNQFWIQSPKSWKSGEQLKIHFRYKCSKPSVTTNTQIHKQNPSEYLIWHAIGDVTFTDKWQDFDGIMTIADDMAGGWSIAFNLNAKDKDAIDFYFDDLSWQSMKLDEGFFVAGQNTATGLEYDFDGAIEFVYDEEEGLYVATIGTAGKQDTWVSEVMISTIRGNDSQFKSHTIKPTQTANFTDFIGDDAWPTYAAASLAKIAVPAGVYTISIDTENTQINFVQVEGDDITTGISEVVNKANTGYTFIYNLAGQRVSKDYKGIVVKNGKKVVVK